MFLFAIHQLCPDTLESYAPFLSPERWHRAGAFRREADRLRCVAAGLLGNFCLWQWCGGRPMTLGRNRYGKPFLEGSPVQFSLSHAGDWAVCGLADCPLGVDIEKVRPVEQGMYGLCLTPQERQQLEQAPMPPERRFIQLWTLKESWIKCRGGRLMELRRTEFLLQGREIVSAPPGFIFRFLPAPMGYVLAICERE